MKFIKKPQRDSSVKNIESSIKLNSDFNSKDGMLTAIWGPGVWHFLHTMSFNYPVHPTNRDKINYKSFILSLKNVLPCGKCRENLKKNFLKLPITMKDMKSRHTFSLYVYNLHEVVNKMLNKKSGLTFEEVRDRYENFRARCNSPSYSIPKEPSYSTLRHEKSLNLLPLATKNRISSNRRVGEGQNYRELPKGISNKIQIIKSGKIHNKTRKVKKEDGCVKPIYGEKSKCVLHIVPQSVKCETLNIDPRCK